MLAVVVCAIALSLAYPVREYIAQRRQIDQLQAQSQATTAELARLRAEAQRLNEPAYIEQQAQDRLHMCLPGASCYVIIGGRPTGVSSAVAAAASTPWYERLWHSVRQADQGSAGEGSTSQGSTGQGSTHHGRPVKARRMPDDPAGAGDTAEAGMQRWSESSSAVRLGGCVGWRTAAPAGGLTWWRRRPGWTDGTPFPTLFYLTCPRAVAAVSRLESGGLMRDMQQRLAAEPALRAAQQAAHRDYVQRRSAAAAAAGVEPLPPGMQSAGGLPDRVKCLHALVAHELAVPGANPLGREAADAAGEWWAHGPCVP